MDYVVVSDMHLGHDVYMFERAEGQRRVDELNENLARFLDRLRQRCATRGVPLTLVILGDFIDFVKASFAYTGEDKAELDFNEDAEVVGLAVTERNMAWKVRRIAAAHAPVFRALGRLVAGGNSVVVVSGNHDSMLFWKEVQRAVEDAIVVDLPDADAGRQRVTFRHWFLYVPGLLYMEHGHRFDPLSTSDFPLLPTDLYDPKRLFLPFNLLTIQFYAQNYYGLTSEQVQKGEGGVGSILSSVASSHRVDRRGVRHLLTPMRIYLGFLWHLTRNWVVGKLSAQEWRRRENELLLRKLAEEVGLPTAVLHQLQQLDVKPFESSLGKVVQLFLADVLALAVLTVVLAPVVVLLALRSPMPAVGLLSAASLVPMLVALVVLRLQGRKQLLRQDDEAVRRAVATIANATRVPAVVLAHTHRVGASARDNLEAIRDRVDGTRDTHRHLSFNSGTWEPGESTASYLHFESGAGGYRVKTVLWDMRTQKEVLLDELPLRPADPLALGGTPSGQGIALGPRLAAVPRAGDDDIVLSGVLDIHGRVDLLVQGVSRLSLDMGGVTKVTSGGVAQWCHAMMGIEPGTRIALYRVPYRLVEAFRTTAGALRPDVRVFSFVQRFQCRSCLRTEDVLLETGLETTPRCTSCGAVLELLAPPSDGISGFAEIARGRVRPRRGQATAGLRLRDVEVGGEVFSIGPGGIGAVLAGTRGERRLDGEALVELLSSSAHRVVITFPEWGATIEAEAEVRWKSVLLDDSVELGMAFTAIGPTARDVLAAFVRRERSRAPQRRRSVSSVPPPP